MEPFWLAFNMPWLTALIVIFVGMLSLLWHSTNVIKLLVTQQQQRLPDIVPITSPVIIHPEPTPEIIPPEPTPEINPEPAPVIITEPPVVVPVLPAPDLIRPFATAPRWFQLGLQDIGIHEELDNTGPAIATFITQAHTGSQHDPWCAIWTNAKLEVSGTRGTRSPSSQSFRTNPAFVALSGPALGCVAVFWRGFKDSGLGHVGFYYGENATKIWVLGGNENDMVQIEAMAKDSASFGFIGYFWPKSVQLPTIGPIMMPTGAPLSIQKPPVSTVMPAIPLNDASEAGWITDITATMFTSTATDGSVTLSAYGGPIVDDHPGVALPFHFQGKRKRVRVVGKKSGLSVDCDIVDIGPWNLKDPYWDTNTRPQAETGTDMTGRHTNKAGIDLTLAAAQAIQLDGKGLVSWEFLPDQQDTPSRRLTATVDNFIFPEAPTKTVLPPSAVF